MLARPSLPMTSEVSRHRNPVNRRLKCAAVGPERQLDIFIRRSIFAAWKGPEDYLVLHRGP